MRRAGLATGQVRQRRGVAATETAVALPVLVLVVFGSIELANGVFLKQALSVAAYEGARTATRPGGTVAAVETRVEQVLAGRSVTVYDLEISPEIAEDTERNTSITVTVSAPGTTYNIGMFPLFEGKTLHGEAIMVRQ